MISSWRLCLTGHRLRISRAFPPMNRRILFDTLGSFVVTWVVSQIPAWVGVTLSALWALWIIFIMQRDGSPTERHRVRV